MAEQMDRRRFLRAFGKSTAMLIGAACTPPASPPVPTTAPAKPAETAKPAEAAKPAPAAPAAAAKPAAQGDRLVVALGQWGTEAPFAWMSAAADKPLWDHMHDSLIHRDPATLAMRPGLAAEWKPSSDFKSWTFKLRQGVMFHDGVTNVLGRSPTA